MSANLKPFIARLAAGETLSADQAEAAFDVIMSGEATPAQIGGLLMAMRLRGETVAEITGAVRAMRARMTAIEAPDGAIDVCGTGGDGHATLNVSTAVSFVLSGCGVPVAKHGNRNMSSKSGAADVLEALGVRIDLSPQQAGACLAETGLCFLFAPLYHPAMKHIAPVRKDLGFRTVFNLLGPLSNPARVRRQLLGVFAERWVEPLAGVLVELDTARSWVVHGRDGMDELTITGPSLVVEVADGKKRRFEIEPGQIGLARATLDKVKGGDAAYNARELELLLHGRGNDAYRDIVILNSAAALTVSGNAESIEEGAELARRALNDGRAHAKLEQLRLATQRFAE